MDVMFLFHLICWKTRFNNFDYFQVLHSPVNSPSWVSGDTIVPTVDIPSRLSGPLTIENLLLKAVDS